MATRPSLASRLGRLTTSRPSPAAVAAPTDAGAPGAAPSRPFDDPFERPLFAAVETSSSARSDEPDPEPPPAPAATPPRVLDDLRARMDAILTRTRAEAPRAPARADLPDLPFAVEDTPLGPLHVRTLRLSGAHRVGRVPVTGARSASSELLALLALDPHLASCLPRGALYLDTETTGLGPSAGVVAFLVGLAFWDDEAGLVVEQLLVRQLGEEAPMLARVAERLARASMLVTFNGKSFDMPVLRTRFVMARMPVPVEPPHLDLVHVARRLHKSRGVGSKLGTVEREVLGFVRVDDVPSGEVAGYYLHFLRTGDTRGLLGVVEHNAWDVVSMAALVSLYGEPLDGTELEATDLVGVARTFRRAAAVFPGTEGGETRKRMFDQAWDAISLAHERGGGVDVVRARAEIAKARGDKARALLDFESLAAQVDDPAVRLELAKLYEHHQKDARRALDLAHAGTGETAAQQEKRIARLEGKVRRPARGKAATGAAEGPRQAAARSHGKTLKLW